MFYFSENSEWFPDLGKLRAAENVGKIQILTTTKILETSGSGTEQTVQGTGVKRVAPIAVQYWARISRVTISTMDDSRERPGSLGLASSTRRRRTNNEMNAHRMLRAITAANSCGHSGGRHVKRYSRPSISCASCKPAHMDASITRTGRNG